MLSLDKKKLINFNIVNNLLTISILSIEHITQHEFSENYKYLLFLKKNNHLTSIVIDFNNLSYNNQNIFAFLISCNSYCINHNIKIILINYTQNIKNFFQKIKILKTNNNIKKNINLIQKIFNIISIKEIIFKISKKIELKEIISFIRARVSVLIYSISYPKKIQYKEIFYYIDKTGADGVPIICFICFLMGAILAFQGILQMERFGLSIFVINFVALSIFKELGSLMVAIVCIGRAGSAFAAEIGIMKVSEEINAMKTMGLCISRFVILPKIIALIIVMPLLTLIGNIMGILGGMCVTTIKLGISASQYYNITINAIMLSDLFEGLIKSIIFAIIIGVMGCFKGLTLNNDAKGIGRASTSAVVSGIFLIVIVDAFLAMFFN